MNTDNRDPRPDDPLFPGSPAEIHPRGGPGEAPAAPGAADPTIHAAGDRPAEPGEGAPRGRARWVVAALAALGVALFAVPLLRGPGTTAGSGSDPVAAGAAAEGCRAQGKANLDFTLTDMYGRDFKLSDYKGKVLLVNFWATWCGPCKIEIPEFVDVYNQYRDQGFAIVGVLSEDDPSDEELRAFADHFKMNYPVLRPHEGLDAAFGPIWALPTTFLVDRNGTICLKHMGPVKKEVIEREIKTLL